MSFTSWLRNLRSVIAPAGLERQRRSKPLRRTPAARFRPQLEVLEDRCLLSAVIVTTAVDGFDGGTAADPAGPDGYLSLREAISAASSGDQITFEQSLSGSTFNLFRGALVINKNLDIVGLGANDLAVSGRNRSVVFVIAADTVTTISGLTIAHGKSGINGGGIINSGTLTVSSCILADNSAFYDGGGIWNAGTLTVRDSTLSGNSAGGNGGAINNFNGTVTVSGSTLFDNSATGSTGGGAGGGIFNGRGALMVSDSTFTDNTAGQGGGIQNLATATVSHTTLTGNSAGAGGAILNIGTLTVNDSTFTHNSAGLGGGIYNHYGIVTVGGSTLTANSATEEGGGIDNYFGTLYVTDSTICENSAPVGADLSNRGTATLTNSDVCVIAKSTPIFSDLTSTTVVVGTSSATLGGQISLGALVPTGSVAITVGAVTVTAAIHADGTFSASVPTGTLPAGSYTIAYSYAGDEANFNPASATGTLVVLSAQQQVGLIVNQANALVTAGILDSGNANALIVKLNNAIASLNSGNTTAGVNQLNAVINLLNAFVKSGKLTSTAAKAFFDAIDLAIAAALFSPL